MDLGEYEYKWMVVIGMLLFFAVRVAIGYWASRRVANVADYIVAGGHVLNKLLGWPLPAGMLIVGTIVTLYTTMGGMWADTLRDFLQMFFTAGGIAFCVLVCVGCGWRLVGAAGRRARSEHGPSVRAMAAGE